MKIEESIKQKRPFRNAYQKVIVNLIYTHNWVVSQLQQHLKPYGITMKQYNVLRIVKGAGKPITTSMIRERLLDKMSDASRMVERLHQKGLVVRTTCASDKRLVDVSLSKEGKKMLEMMSKYENEMDDIVGQLNEIEAEQLSELLDKLRK